MRPPARLAVRPIVGTVLAGVLVAAAAAPASAAATGMAPPSALPGRTLPAGSLSASVPAVSTLRVSAPPVSTLRHSTDAPAASARPPAALAGGPATAPVGVGALGADLADAGTGQLLWGRDANTKRPMGSVTKVMTALVVIQAGDLGRKITVPASAVSYVASHGASSAGLRNGDVLTARQLLDAMLLPSGCDAAYVLATAYGPGRAAFVAKMNAEARHLGLAKTHFSNFDGLPYPTPRATYSTPASLIALGRAAMALAAFRATVDRRAYHLAARNGHHAYTWRNTNLLLGSYAGTDGIKTGFTKAAGYCLLFEAHSGAGVLIGVVLHSTATKPGDRFTDARRMLRWGFSVLTASATLTGRLSRPDS